MTNAGQAVTASLTLSAFGQTVSSSGSSTSAYQYGATSGYRNDGDAGLTLVGCRFYDAQVGRFISRDTDLDQAPYAYCDGDPVDSTDPSGHAAGDPPGGKAPYPPLPKPSPPSDPGGIPTPNPPIKINLGGGRTIITGIHRQGVKITGVDVIYTQPIGGGGEAGVGVYAPIGGGPLQPGFSIFWPLPQNGK